MYGPPPDCKRFEVERSDSLRKCIRPLSGELFSGHSMMIRACRSFQNPAVSKDAFKCPGIPARRLDCWFVFFSPQQTLVEHPSMSSSWRWESGKRFLLSKRSVFSTAKIRLRSPATVGVDSFCRWIVPPMRCEPVCWRSRPRLYSVAHAGQADAPTARDLPCHV